MAQAAPQSGAHLRGRERHAVASARAIASGKGVNDVVGAGAALADHRSTAGHDFMNTSDVQKQTTVGGQSRGDSKSGLRSVVRAL